MSNQPLVLATVLLSTLAACHGSDRAEHPDHVQFVLGEEGIGGIAFTPEKAQVHTADGEQVTIDAGETFSVTLARGAVDLQIEQQRVIDDKRLQLQEFVVHDDDTLVWRWGPADDSERYHFVYTASLEGEAFNCRSTDGQRFRHEDVLNMIDACKSVRFDPTESGD